MKSLTHFETTPPPCCSPSQAASWLDAVVWMSLRGEATPHDVAEAVDHWLQMIRAAGVTR